MDIFREKRSLFSLLSSWESQVNQSKDISSVITFMYNDRVDIEKKKNGIIFAVLHVLFFLNQFLFSLHFHMAMV